MNSPQKKTISLIIRYLSIFLVGLFNLSIFYKLFTTPTIFYVSKMLDIFGSVSVFQNIILFNQNIIQIIPACIAGSAYYLLFILLTESDIDVIIFGYPIPSPNFCNILLSR